LDARRKKQIEGADQPGIDPEWLTKPLDETYTDKSLEKALKALSKNSYEERLKDSNMGSKLVGNTYTASVFFGLASLLDRVGGRGELTPGKSIAVFSYGSGAIATMYRLSV
jgi:hydroxymethylglutaryl-CoA synthase